MVSKSGSIPGEVAREVVDRRMDVVGEEEGEGYVEGDDLRSTIANKCQDKPKKKSTCCQIKRYRLCVRECSMCA